MKKRILLVALVAVMSIGTSRSQIILLDEDEGSFRSTSDLYELENVLIPDLGSTNDQYTPIGSGLLLLAGMGGAYLLTKKTKKSKK